MKTKFEAIMDKAKMSIKKAFEPELLHHAVYYPEAAMIFRRDGRDITVIAEEGGYTGRTFSGRVRDTKHYALVNRPSIGYGGCISMEHAINWGVGREPLNMTVHITCPSNNTVINMVAATLRYQFGDIHPEPGSKCLSTQELIAEQEFLTVNDVPMKQILLSVDKNHIDLLRENVAVPNQLRITGIDSTAPEMITRQDCANSTAMLVACLQQNCLEKAEVIATKLAAERVQKEAGQNNYGKKTQQELFCFWKVANPTKEFKLAAEESFSVSMAHKS